MTDDILQVHCQSLRCQLWQCKAFLTMFFLCPDLTNNNEKMVTSDEHCFCSYSKQTLTKIIVFNIA